MSDLISIIIRTRNEERWITQCLNMVAEQEYDNFEVVIVDNKSQDKTIEKASQFKARLDDRLKIISCEEYLPGKALNRGIEASEGFFIACLSGHCIPTDKKWLCNLRRNFDEAMVAGVYGRQEPLVFTSDADKRDLALVFGLDRRVQRKDCFFHNANSMIRRDVWEDYRFDESVTNIEDRIWAQRVQQEAFKIIYEPEASVYHYHGIHQNGDAKRCANVVRILEHMHDDYDYKSIDVEKLNIVALIPVKGPIQHLNGKPLIAYTIERARESKYIKKIIVSTDNKELASIAETLGANVPFLRDPSFSRDEVTLADVLKYSLKRIEDAKILPDIVLTLEVTFPFRPKGLLDDMILQLAKNGYDSVVAAKRENKAIWKETDETIAQIDEGLTPRKFKDPTFIELRGIGCITHPEFIRGGRILGEKIGIYEVNNPYSHLEVRSEEDFNLASPLIKEWF